MDLRSMTYIELFKLYRQVGWEMFSRTWWILPIMAVVFIVVLVILNRK
jgi:hypothetical protein